MTQPQKKTRRQMLEEFVAAKPNDAFARYGLAMECANAGDPDAPDHQFTTLLGAHPDYVAPYFQYGPCLPPPVPPHASPPPLTARTTPPPLPQRAHPPST